MINQYKAALHLEKNIYNEGRNNHPSQNLNHWNKSTTASSNRSL
jgi:hypothetical protein